MARLPRINDDKGQWGIILNQWLKQIGGYAGAAGYGTNLEFDAENSGLNFHSTDPVASTFANATIPAGFTYINTTANEIRRWTGAAWVVLLRGTAGADIYVNGGSVVNNPAGIPNILRLTRTDGGVVNINLSNLALKLFDVTPGTGIALTVNGVAVSTQRSINSNDNVGIAVDPNALPAINFTAGSNVTINGQTGTVPIKLGQTVTIASTTTGGQGDADWYVANTANTVPTNITQNVYTRGRVGIGDVFETSNPVHDLEIRSTRIVPMGVYTRNNNDGSSVQMFRSRDNAGANANLNAGDNIASMRAFGYAGTDYSFVGNIDIVAGQNFGTSRSSFMRFGTIAQGETNITEKLRIAENGFLGVLRQNPRYTIDASGSVGAYFGGFLADSAYRIVNGAIQYPTDINAANDDYPNGGFMALRHFSKRRTGADAEVFDWTLINNKRNTQLGQAAGLHFWAYNYYSTPYSPIGAATSRMVITDNGRVGINAADPAHTLTVVIPGTNITGSYQASGWVHSSDGRMKSNVNTLDKALEKVKQLRGVSFDWKGNEKAGKQIGFIAQEVQKVVPELVSGKEGDMAKGETLSMNYSNMAPLLIEAIKEQQAIIEKLQARIEALENK